MGSPRTYAEWLRMGHTVRYYSQLRTAQTNSKGLSAKTVRRHWPLNQRLWCCCCISVAVLPFSVAVSLCSFGIVHRLSPFSKAIACRYSLSPFSVTILYRYSLSSFSIAFQSSSASDEAANSGRALQFQLPHSSRDPLANHIQQRSKLRTFELQTSRSKISKFLRTCSKCISVATSKLQSATCRSASTMLFQSVYLYIFRFYIFFKRNKITTSLWRD